MTTPAKLYGKDLSEYDDIDVESLLAQLSADEISILAKEVDPDVSIYKHFLKHFLLGLKNKNFKYFIIFYKFVNKYSNIKYL